MVLATTVAGTMPMGAISVAQVVATGTTVIAGVPSLGASWFWGWWFVAVVGVGVGRFITVGGVMTTLNIMTLAFANMESARMCTVRRVRKGHLHHLTMKIHDSATMESARMNTANSVSIQWTIILSPRMGTMPRVNKVMPSTTQLWHHRRRHHHHP